MIFSYLITFLRPPLNGCTDILKFYTPQYILLLLTCSEGDMYIIQIFVSSKEGQKSQNQHAISCGCESPCVAPQGDMRLTKSLSLPPARKQWKVFGSGHLFCREYFFCICFPCCKNWRPVCPHRPYQLPRISRHCSPRRPLRHIEYHVCGSKIAVEIEA